MIKRFAVDGEASRPGIEQYQNERQADYGMKKHQGHAVTITE
jgi:hypothetical protein